MTRMPGFSAELSFSRSSVYYQGGVLSPGLTQTTKGIQPARAISCECGENCCTVRYGEFEYTSCSFGVRGVRVKTGVKAGQFDIGRHPPPPPPPGT
jgi:hypothetical protein